MFIESKNEIFYNFKGKQPSLYHFLCFAGFVNDHYPLPISAVKKAVAPLFEIL